MADQSKEAETLQVKSIVESVPRMAEIEDISFRFDNDWSGDPAMYLSFVVAAGVSVDQAFIERFLDYTQVIQRKILDSGIERFPYTDIQQAA